MNNLTFTLDGETLTASPGQTILEAALQNGVYIPHLCGHESLTPAGACGMCAVGVKGADGIILACSTKVKDGMDVNTRDELAEKTRKLACDFIFKTHPSDCTDCPKYGRCQLQTILQYVGDTGRNLRENKLIVAADEKNPIIMHEMHRCILCGRCVRVCTDVRGVGAIRFDKNRERTRIVVDGESLENAGCRFCTACVDVCPTGSIREHEAIAAKMEGKTREAAFVPCRDACPAHIDVPRYIRHIGEGDYHDAVSVIREKVPFPYVLGYVCSHPCEPECKRSYINGAVSIRNLKRFAAQHGVCTPEHETLRPTGKRAAVVGAGPAGLTAAYYLARKGHDVTVFEQNAQPGGMMRYGIPAHRLPRNILDDEIAGILSAGVTLKTGTKIENAPALLKDGFDAVFTSVGAHRGVKLPIPGAELDGVYTAVEFLRTVETQTAPAAEGRRVMILGGGNVAMDCATVALRLGASEVHAACIETYDAMPCSEEERRWAQEEGVVIHDGVTFTQIVDENGHAAGVEIKPISGGEEKTIGADFIIFAVGQHPDINPRFGLELGESGRIAVSSDCSASVPGVFAAGDAVTGTDLVIKAIAGARTAAEKIDVYLGGDGVIDEQLAPPVHRNPYLGKKEGFGAIARSEEHLLPPEQRVRCFDAMDLGLGSAEAACEAERCLQCDLRLDIAPQRFWTDYSKDIGGAAI